MLRWSRQGTISHRLPGSLVGEITIARRQCRLAFSPGLVFPALSGPLPSGESTSGTHVRSVGYVGLSLADPAQLNPR